MTNYSKQGKANRRKGINFELKICKKLRKLFPDVKRNLEFQGGSADIFVGNLAIQCKNLQDYPSINTFNEIPQIPHIEMGEGTGVKKWKRRILITKAKRKPAMVVMELDTFINLLNEQL